MSKLIRSARNLLSPERKPAATLPDEGYPEGAEGAEREQGSRMNSDICVPKLGHSTGYAHEILPPTAGAPSPLTQTTPQSSTTPLYSAPKSSHGETAPLAQSPPKTRAVSPFKLKVPLLGKGGERSAPEPAEVVNAPGRRDRVEKRATG